MNHLHAPLYALTLALLWACSLSAMEIPQALMPERHVGFLETYCLDCHDTETEKGSVNLEELPFDLGTLPAAERWQKVLNAINSGEMPPPKKAQPKPDEKADFLADLSSQLVVARKLLSDSGGTITMRRLNRREYQNTIRELLGVTVDVNDLPDDEGAGSFDTVGASLFFSSDQFEQYLKIGRTAIDAALVDGPEPKPVSMHVEAEVAATKRMRARMQALERIKARAEAWRQSDGKPPTAFGFIDEARVIFEMRGYERNMPTYRALMARPETKTGALMANMFNAAFVQQTVLPAKAPLGRYRVKARVAALPEAKSYQRFLELGFVGAESLGGELELIACEPVHGSFADPQVVTFEFEFTGSSPRTLGLRARQHNNRSAAQRAVIQSITRTKDGVGPPPPLWLDWVEVEGPLQRDWPPRAQQEFLGGLQNNAEPANIRERIVRFATRAFRGKAPRESFVDRLMDLYQAERDAGKAAPAALHHPLSVILASPSFLYMVEPSIGAQNRELDDRELAVRLSYLLWSAPPDQELLELAEQGQLQTPAVLRAQTHRLIEDPRAQAFVSGFVHQWLDMERLDFFQFNDNTYPSFDDSAKAAARAEVYETFKHILHEGLPVGRLLKSDFAMINNLLGEYYGIKGAEGSAFQKVALPPDSPRGGLLGMAAIHAMGSDGERSSPVERGTWVLRHLLHDAPPPAPANVPQLSRLPGATMTARELQVAHMEEPQCAQCHRKIDPIGFGMENFTAAGKWRDEETILIPKVKKTPAKTLKTPVDASGTLPDGTAFRSFHELRDAVARREDAFARGFTEAIIEYGLGRPYGFTDQDLADAILATARQKNYALNEFIYALVQSSAFRRK